MLDIVLIALLASDPIVEPYDAGVTGARAYAVSESPDGRRQVVTRQETGALPVLYWRERNEDGEWGQARPITFEGLDNAADGFFTPDGRHMIFMHLAEDEPRHWDLWSVGLTEDGWAEPVRLEAISQQDFHEIYPTMDARGRIVFATDRGDQDGRAIWMATPNGESFDLAPLEGEINSNPTLSNPLILPDGEAIIFYARDPETEPGPDMDTNLFISCHSNGRWSAAVELGAPINTTEGEFAPGLSHDGAHFYFTRNEVLHRASMALIEEARSQACAN